MDLDKTQTRESGLGAKAGWTVVSFGITLGGFGAWGSWTTFPLEALIAPLLIAAGLIGIAMIWKSPTAPSRGLERGLFLLATGSAFVNQVVSLLGRSYYETDSAAFNEAATRLLLSGKNPYATSLAPYATPLLKNANAYWTYTLGGGHISAVSYPAASFLFEVPLHWLGMTHLPADLLDLVAASAAIVLLWFALPISIRWLSPALLLSFIYFGTFANGGTDALFLPFLMLAVWRWDRFVDESASVVARWSGPIALGVACSIKQSPWFCVPFLLVGIGIEAHRSAKRWWPHVATYLGIVSACFVLLNAPFILWSPSAWWHGITLPLTDPLIPDGSGIVTLVLHGLLPSVRLTYLSVAGLFVEVALLASFVVWYRPMKRVWLFLLPLVLFWPGRSLSSYLVDFLPAAIVAVATVRNVESESGFSFSKGHARLAVAIPSVLAGSFVVAAFAMPVLSLATVSVTSSDQGQSIIAIRVKLTNDTNATVRPHLMVDTNTAHPDGFWIPSHHSEIVLAPHETEQVILYPPTWVWAPGKGQFLVVQAFTKTPASLSTTVPYRWLKGTLPN